MIKSIVNQLFEIHFNFHYKRKTVGIQSQIFVNSRSSSTATQKKCPNFSIRKYSEGKANSKLLNVMNSHGLKWERSTEGGGPRCVWKYLSKMAFLDHFFRLSRADECVCWRMFLYFQLGSIEDFLSVNWSHSPIGPRHCERRKWQSMFSHSCKLLFELLFC